MYAGVRQNLIKQVAGLFKNDPHRREYYLPQTPLTAEQLGVNNRILENGLYHFGVILKDRLDNLRLTEKASRHVNDDYPDYELMDDVHYHLYLLYMRRNELRVAENYAVRLIQKFPKGKWTAPPTGPYYKQNFRSDIQIEDSLYAATYEALKQS